MTTRKNYYELKKNVMQYISMAKGFDGKQLIEILKKHLKKGSSVLELGMGPGKDLDMLKKDFRVTGSDISAIFLERYIKKNPDADLIYLDAVTLNTKRKFDCLYSNKVLHHLSTKELKASIKRQKKLLNPNGILFHSFWRGDNEEDYKGLHFVYYTKDELINYFGKDYEIIDVQLYKEMEPDDSIYIILKNS